MKITASTGEIIWNIIASAAESIWSFLVEGYDVQEMPLEESDACVVDIESFFNGSGEGEAGAALDDDDTDEISEPGGYWYGHGPVIYVDTINVYNYCEKCENKS